MLAAVLLASAAVVYVPPGVEGMWSGKGGQFPEGHYAMLRIETDGLALIRSTYDPKTFADTGRTEMRCVYTGQVPGVYQYAVACEDGETYTLTMRDPGGQGRIEDATIEFDGITFVYGDGG